MPKEVIGATGLIDPPWAYQQASRHERLSGFSTDHEYPSLTTDELRGLPIAQLMRYGFLWTTGPFIEDAYSLIRSWGMLPITMLAWVKCAEINTDGLPAFPDRKAPENTFDPEVIIKPTFGVGYWFRGCVEPIIVFKAPDAPSIRTPFVGLLSPNARHSRKPETLHHLIESHFPGPYLELFGRRERPGWNVFGNEAPQTLGEDIRSSLKNYLDSQNLPSYVENGDCPS